MTGRDRFKLRPATVKDLATLVHHRRAMWENMGVKDKRQLASADKAYGRWAGERLRDRTLHGWVVENGEGLVVGSGCLWLQPRQPSPGNSENFQPYLLSMYTMPGYRGKGLASKIVQEAVKWTRQNRYASLRLHASEMGRGVYRKLGFKRTWEMRRNFPTR
jgi:GNAT superfamily N-acetyltransferase